jgi:hypothetical protein
MLEQEPSIPPQEEPESPSPSLGRRLWTWLKRIVLWAGVLLLVLFGVLQLPPVQNWLAQRVTKVLSDQMQTTVSIDRLQVLFLDELLLEGFYVEDLRPNDTLLYSRRLYADFSLNPITYLRRGLVIEELELDSATVNIRTLEGESETNVQTLLGRLITQDTSQVDEDKRPFRLDVQRLQLRQVRFLKEDKVRGQYLDILLEEGQAIFDEFSLPDNAIHAEQVRLTRPFVKVYAYEEQPIITPEGDTLDPWAIDTTLQLDTLPKQPFYATISELRLEDGRFSLHNWRNAPVKTTPADQLDYQHMAVYDINIGIDRFTFCADSLDFEGEVKQFALQDSSGFVLENLTVGDGRVWNHGLALYDMKLKTPYSEIGDTLIFRYDTYEDFKDFPMAVEMEGHINGSIITLHDVITFAPKLDENDFFRANRDRRLFVDGLFEGEVNNLDAKDMYIALEDRSLVAEGNLRTTNLIVPDGRIINLELDLLRTRMRTLRQLLPRFRPPESFDRLGWLNFQGNFDVFFSDYIAYGQLNSALGKAELDMQIRNLDKGRDQASYGGELSLIDFDLGAFTQSPDLGLVNFYSKVFNGVGLTGDKARAELYAEVESFLFKGYNYKNAILNGDLKKNQFRGDFAIQDENIDFTFGGQVDFSDSIPKFNFDAKVNRLVMQALNLTEKPLILSGQVDFDLQNSSLADLEGDGRIGRFTLQHLGKDTIQVDSVVFSSYFLPSGDKRFTINSDIVQAELLGRFNVEQVGGAFMGYLQRNYPVYFERLGLKPPKQDIRDNSFTYNIDIIDTKGLLQVFAPQLDRIEGANVKGVFDNTIDSIYVSAYIPHFQYNNVALNDVGLFLWLEDSVGSANLRLEEIVLNDKTSLQPIQILAEIEKDTLDMGLAYEAADWSFLDNLNVNAHMFVEDSLNYKLQFEQSDLVIMEKPWLIDSANYITFRKGYVNVEHFSMASVRNPERRVALRSKGKRGLALDIFNLDFSFIDDIWEYKELDFRGPFNLFTEVENVFELQNLQVRVEADTFFVNEDDWGALSLTANAKDLDSPYEAYLAITKESEAAQLIAEGYFNPKDQNIRRRSAEENKAKYFDFDLDVTGFPMSIAEYWIGSSVSNTVGRFDTRIDVFGFPEEPHIGGTIGIRDGATTVDFLQTRYFFPTGTVIANDFLFDASGNFVYDKDGNRASIRGGITHDHLKNLGIDATLSTERFLALNTGKGDNELFYGTALGKGDVIFTGPFSAVDIYVNATVGKDTRLVIPVSYGSETSEELNFIKFVDEKEREKTLDERANSVKQSLTGVNLEMDLTITEEAVGEIIFDEQAGDIIKGQGRGDIRILVPRSGDFQMFGDYIIEQGNYLFTLYNVVNKDFDIKRGGRITWSGDPFEAQIRLEAEYRGLSTPVSNFIQEYLVDAPPQLQRDASQTTDVDLTMLLRGDLLKPVINFEIDFPQLVGGLKTLTDSKLRILEQDPNEMNRQVFGLIVVGQFLPSDLAFQGTDIFYNTVSEFVSNQLSLLLTELFSEFFAEGSKLSGIDFDFAYNQYQATLGESEDLRRGDEFQVRLRQQFFDDRLSILVGGNVDIGNSARVPDASGTFLGNDVVIEYYINRDRTLKMRVYQRLEPDIGGGSRLEVGTGLSYRKEFDSFGEFLRSFRRDSEKVKD